MMFPQRRKFFMFFVVFLLAVIFCGAASAANVTVTPGTDAIKNAINKANPGDTLNLKAGTYNESGLVVDKNLIITGPTVTGNKTPTAVIDAQGKGGVFTINSGVTVNLKNLLIKNGNTTNTNGGGIYNKGNLTITKCTFTNNTARGYGHYYNVVGGAIYNTGTLTVTGCSFTGNTADTGGAINNTGTVKVTNCTFTNNLAISMFAAGGVIYNAGGTLTVSGSTFTNNKATGYDGSGGAIYNSDGTLTVTNSTFTENTAYGLGGEAGSGGAIYNEDNVTISGCNFTNNKASDGGAIYNSEGLNVSSSTFTNNNASSEGGGAISNHGDLTVAGCIFASNTADGIYGSGAIYNSYGTLTASDCTFIGNTATNYGGAIYNYDGTLTVNGCNFVSNSAASLGNAIYNEFGDSYSSIVNFNRFYDKADGYEIYCASSTLDARYNWWGSNKDPSGKVYGNVDVGPWMVLKVNVSPAVIKVSSTSKITANLCYDSDGVYHKPADGHVPDGIKVTFTTTLGTIKSSASTVDGKAQATLKSGTTTGVAKVSVSLDDQVVKKSITINP